MRNRIFKIVQIIFEWWGWELLTVWYSEQEALPVWLHQPFETSSAVCSKGSEWTSPGQISTQGTWPAFPPICQSHGRGEEMLNQQLDGFPPVWPDFSPLCQSLQKNPRQPSATCWIPSSTASPHRDHLFRYSDNHLRAVESTEVRWLHVYNKINQTEEMLSQQLDGFPPSIVATSSDTQTTICEMLSQQLDGFPPV